ncbi:MAG: glycosyltransferase family 1 protein [Candidatus Magasanikiibacteriota bacterium]
MKIGIDARMMGSKQAGLGRYVEQLVLGLLEQDKENEYVLFTNNGNTPCLPATADTPLKRGFKIVEANIPWYSWQEQTKFKKIIDREKIDLMHFPHWNVPLFYNKPFVVTVHDLIMYHYPRQEASTHGPFVYWLKDLGHRLVLNHAVQKAKHIIVTSEFTKQDLHQTLGVSLEKMTVTYQAPFQNTIHDSHNTTQVLKKNNVEKPYVLYVGNAYPHKNLEGLLKSWKIFNEKYGNEYQLVLVGKKNFFYERLLKDQKIERSKDQEEKSGFSDLPIFRSSIIFTDYVTDNELSQLYVNASLYVFPSLYEGFGLPPLEAQQYNVPVVSSSASCLPEILGESALYFDPENYEQMAEVIYTGLTNEDMRFELRQNARENLKRFNLNNMISQTLLIYNNIVKLLHY